MAVVDRQGGQLGLNSYDEYGLPGGDRFGRFLYTGQAYLREVDLYHYKARVYSPRLGRFLQTDPIGYDDQVNLYAYVGNDPVNHADPTGMRDIYIGGAADKDRTRIVQDYAARQQQLHPDRDVRYFSYSEWKEIISAASEPLRKGEPLNIIGHSLGGAVAINIANARSEINITNLISIDPVSSSGSGSKPGNVGAWANVTAVPSSYNFSDAVASGGRTVLGTPNTAGADISLNSSASHGDFSTMMSEIHALQAIDSSYRNMLKLCGNVQPC